MNQYIPEPESTKRKKIEVALVSCNREIKKSLEENPWILDFLEEQLTKEQVNELDTTLIIEGIETDVHAHDLIRVIKQALATIDVTGKEFAKLRILRNDGVFPSHYLIKRNIFVCCRSIKDINIDVIVDFSELLNGYLKARKLRDIHPHEIIADAFIGNNKKEDIFTIAKQHGRLPKVAKFLEIVKNNLEKIAYVPSSIRDLLLRDQNIRSQYVEVLAKLPFETKKLLIPLYPTDVLANIFALEQDLTIVLQQNTDAQKYSSLSMLKLHLALITKNGPLIRQYLNNIEWNSVRKPEITHIFSVANKMDGITQLIPLQEISSQINADKEIPLEQYSEQLKTKFDKIWSEPNSYWTVYDTVKDLLNILPNNKLVLPVKYLLFSMTLSELDSQKYESDLERDIILADAATLFLPPKTFCPDLGIDADLITRLSAFLTDLRVAVRNETPSPYEKDMFTIPYIAHVLYHFKDPWKALKPLLLLFRALPHKCVNLEQEVMEQATSDESFSVPWFRIPFAITSILAKASKNDTDANEIRLNWFKDMAERLKPVKGNKAQLRTYEEILPQFQEGFVQALKEPHPVWRLVYCEAAGDLRVNPGNKGRFVFDKVKENDSDKEVRKAAAKTARRLSRIKNQIGEGAQKTALMNAWWWYRVGHITATGRSIDMALAEKIKSKEVRRNYEDK